MEPLTPSFRPHAAGSINVAGSLSRRDVLRCAAGLGVSLVLPGLSARAAHRRGTERAKSLIVLWMGGGPSQLETWDPHPGSPIGGPTRAIDTRLPGLQIAEMYPHLAEEIHHLSVVRSLVSKEGDHERGTYFVKTGYRPNPVDVHPSLGAILAHELPATGLEIPAHVALGNTQWPPRGGYLGDKFDAFKVYEPGRGVRNMEPRVSQDRQQRRLRGLDVVSQAFQNGRGPRVEGTLHQLTVERALQMMTSEQLAAFEIDGEPADVRARYGDTKFGRGCLVARRLVEQGVRAIEVDLSGWDTHANNFEGHRTQAEQLDPAFAALIRDLRERDLLASTLVLCIGEFGRTPKVNPLDGRDHHPNGFSCVVGGGGLRSGVVISETDPQNRDGTRYPKAPVKVQDLFATVLSTLGVDPTQELITPIGRPLALSEGSPLQALMPDSLRH